MIGDFRMTMVGSPKNGVGWRKREFRSLRVKGVAQTSAFEGGSAAGL